MNESTRIISLSVIGTSLLSVALGVGLLIILHPLVEKKLKRLFVEANHSVAGKDTPVSVRGGSMIVRAKDATWQQPTATSPKGTYNYFSNIGTAAKDEIFVRGDNLNYPPIPASNLPWVIKITNRDTKGQIKSGEDNDAQALQGIMLCSEPDCSIQSRGVADTNVYLQIIDPTEDGITYPDGFSDDDNQQSPPASPPPPPPANLHRMAYQSKSGCKKCERISHIIVKTPSAESIFQCQNSACEVSLLK